VSVWLGEDIDGIAEDCFALVAATTDQSHYSPVDNEHRALAIQTLLAYLHSKRFALTQSGRLGIVPNIARAGDLCCIIQGFPAPLVLRKTPDDCYTLVEASFINGVMAGALMRQRETDIILL